MIEFRHLRKEYPSANGTLVALDDINLSIENGVIYGIIGLSGAGKSTLVRCMNLLERPTEGEVLVDGENLVKVSGKRLREIRRNIGMIFQNFNLLEQRTVEANVRFPLELIRTPKEQAKRRIAELLRLVGLSDKAKAYPSQLSGGQKQRVAIARALATDPKYLLCDEATSALDPNTTNSILQLLKSINRELGVTIVVITHEMKVVESICSHVAVIDNGKVVEQGKVTELFSHPKSDIAKELILPGLIRSYESGAVNKLRLVFDGSTTDEPLISALSRECGIEVNILFADTKTIDGKTFGHMVIALPDEEQAVAQAKAFFDKHAVIYKEEI